MNTLLFSFVWGIAPVAINLIAFGSFLYLAGGELDVATAFTSIALLNMLRAREC